MNKKTTEEIISANGIDNASDATLVRLAGLAVSMPDEDIESLVQRTTFSHPRDKVTARAVIESIRASALTPAAPKRSNVLLVGLVVAAVGLGLLSAALALQLSAERKAQTDQAAQFSESLKSLQSSTAAEHAAGEHARNQAVENLGKEWAKALAEIKALAAENADLKAAAAARAKADAAAAPKAPSAADASPSAPAKQ